ncbi:MAG TPA: hypothetical protein VMQ50_13225 [Casimicrobiaceae bacterium]|nr:hypothetical protein [Casimicrobiaceae bacterium]
MVTGATRGRAHLEEQRMFEARGRSDKTEAMMNRHGLATVAVALALCGWVILCGANANAGEFLSIFGDPCRGANVSSGDKWTGTDHCITVQVDAAGKANLYCVVGGSQEVACDNLRLSKDLWHWILWRLDKTTAGNYVFARDNGVEFTKTPTNQFHDYQRPPLFGESVVVWYDYNTDGGEYYYTINLVNKKPGGTPVRIDPSVKNGN